MYQPDGQSRELLGQQGKGGFGGPRVDVVRFFDEGADPVGLPAVRAGGPDPLYDVSAPLGVQQGGGNRCSAWGQLVYYRAIQIGIGNH